MAENEPVEIDAMLTPMMGDNWPVIKEFLTKKPNSTRVHPATMSALNQALYNVAATVSSEYIHLRPELDSWVYRVFRREKLESIHYMIERTIIDPMILQPAPEGSTFEYSTFQYMQRKGILSRFRLGFHFSLDDLMTPQGARRFIEFTFGLVYAETSLALGLAIQCLFSYPLRILRGDDQPSRPNANAPDFPDLWKEANDCAYALADPLGLYKMTQLADIIAGSYNKDIKFDNIVLPPGSQIFILHGTNHYGTYSKGGLITTRDMGNKQIIYEGFTDRNVFEQPVWKLANLEQFEGDPMGRQCIWSLWSALFRNGHNKKPDGMDWETWISIDMPDQEGGSGKYSSFGPRNGLFEAMNVFKTGDFDEDYGSEGQGMGRLDPAKVRMMFPAPDSPVQGVNTPFTWIWNKDKGGDGKLRLAKFLGDVPFECRDISKDDAKHISDMMNYLSETCMVDCAATREALRKISKIQEELSIPHTVNTDALLDAYGDADVLDTYYGINKLVGVAHAQIPIGYGGINGLMYLYDRADEFISMIAQNQRSTSPTYRILATLLENMPLVIEFVNKLMTTYPDCVINHKRFCPPYCKTNDDHMKQFYAVYVMACERFTLYPVWVNVAPRLRTDSVDLKFEELLTQGMRTIYDSMKSDGSYILKSDMIFENSPPIVQRIQKAGEVPGDKEKLDLEWDVAKANAFLNYVWGAPNTPPQTKMANELFRKHVDDYLAKNLKVIRKVVENLTSEKVTSSSYDYPLQTQGAAELPGITPFVLRMRVANIGKYIPSDTRLGYYPLSPPTKPEFGSAHMGGIADPAVTLLEKRKATHFQKGPSRKFPVHPILLLDLTEEGNPLVYSDMLNDHEDVPPFSPQMLQRLHHYGTQEDPLIRSIGKAFSLCHNSLATFRGCIDANVAPPITAYLAIQFDIQCRTQAAFYAETGCGMYFTKATDLGVKEQTDYVHAEMDVVNTMWAACDVAEPERFHVVLNCKGSGYISGFDTTPLECHDPNDLDLLETVNQERGSVMVIPLPSTFTRSDIPSVIPLFGKELGLYRKNATFNVTWEHKFKAFLNYYEAFARMYGLTRGASPTMNTFNPNSYANADFGTNYSGLVWPVKHRETATGFEHKYNSGPFKDYGPDLRDVMAGTIPFTIGSSN